MLTDKLCCWFQGSKITQVDTRVQSKQDLGQHRHSTRQGQQHRLWSWLCPWLRVFTGFLSETICVSHSHLCSLTRVSRSNQGLGNLYWVVQLVSISFPFTPVERLISKVPLWSWQMGCALFVLAKQDVIYLSLQNRISYICPLQDRMPVLVTQGGGGVLGT